MGEKFELTPELRQEFMNLLSDEDIENVNGGTDNLGAQVVLCPKDNSRMRYDSCSGTFTCIYGHTWF